MSVMLQNKRKSTKKQKHQVPVRQRGTKGVSDVFPPFCPTFSLSLTARRRKSPPDNVWVFTTPTTESKPGINAIHQFFPRSVNCPKKELVACAWVYSSSSVDKNTTHRHLGSSLWLREVRPAATKELFHVPISCHIIKSPETQNVHQRVVIIRILKWTCWFINLQSTVLAYIWVT